MEAASFQGSYGLLHDDSLLSRVWHPARCSFYPARLGTLADLPLDHNWLPESRLDTTWKCNTMCFLLEHLTWNWDVSQHCSSEMYDCEVSPLLSLGLCYSTIQMKRLGQMNFTAELLQHHLKSWGCWVEDSSAAANTDYRDIQPPRKGRNSSAESFSEKW